MNNFEVLNEYELEIIDGGIDWNGIGGNVSAVAGCYVGSQVGEKIGIAIGSAGGPVGMVVGGIVGAAVGYGIYSLFD